MTERLDMRDKTMPGKGGSEQEKPLVCPFCQRGDPCATSALLKGGSEQMSGHTPGPWIVGGAGGINAIVRGADLTIVAKRHRLPGAVHEANARLIAAAPDLLEALKYLLDSIPHHEGDDNLTEPIACARAAIAKA